MNRIFDKQKQFFDKILLEYKDKNKIERIKDYCLGINKNVISVLEAFDWDISKTLKSTSALYQQVESVDAAIDIIKYALDIILEYDINAEIFEYLFMQKSQLVDFRLRQKRFEKEEFGKFDRAFILDIDGVIADIAKAYKIWFGKVLEINFESYAQLEEWKTKNIDEYRRIKETYRLSGYKAEMPMVEKTYELLELCHELGIVVLLSNRPVKSYPIIEVYTVSWLYKKNLNKFVDMIYFADIGDKRYFFDKFDKKKVYFFDDSPNNLIKADERPNVMSIFVKNETNIGIDVSPIKTISDLNEAIEFIKGECCEKNNNSK